MSCRVLIRDAVDSREGAGSGKSASTAVFGVQVQLAGRTAHVGPLLS